MKFCRFWIAVCVLAGPVGVHAQQLDLFHGFGHSGGARWRIDEEVYTYRTQNFIDRKGNRIRLGGDLAFDSGAWRVSYAPYRTLSVGIALPYRRSYFESSEQTAAFRTHGVPGLQIFADWRPDQRLGAFAPSMRLELFRPTSGGDMPITTNDDVTTVTSAFNLTSVPALYRSHGRAAVIGDFQYGFRHETRPRYLAGELFAATGPQVGTFHHRSLFLSGLAGFRLATAARQEGNFLANRSSRAAVAGAMLSLASELDARDLVTVSFSRDIAPQNALSGWRVALSIRTQF